MSKLKVQGLNVIKYLTVVAVIGLISLLFPKSSDFQYNYSLGNVWSYNDLIAPYDFPLVKSEKDLAMERNAVFKDFIPYYLYDENLESEVKNEFVKDLDKLVQESLGNEQVSDITRRPLKYKNKGLEIIERSMKKGIVAEANSHLDTFSSQIIHALTGDDIKSMGRGNLLSHEEAKINMSTDLNSWNADDADLLLSLLNQNIKPNLQYDKEKSNLAIQEELSKIAPREGIVRKGELIAKSNSIVSKEVYQKIDSFKKSAQSDSIGGRVTFLSFLGYLILTTLLIGSFLMFLQFNAKYIYDRYKSLLFLLILILTFSYLVYLVEGLNDLSTYMIPFCIIPILGITFFTDRLAFFLHIIVILLASFISNLGYEFTFLQIFAGIVTVLTFRATRHWNVFFRSVALIFFASIAAFLGLTLLREGSLYNPDWKTMMWLFVSSFLTLMAFPLIPLLERIFGFTSSITLAELSDLNKPLLKKLSNEAAGTFQHSLQVSNLSEAAAEKIGANSLLVKVAALYHDIGKLKSPEHFIENQSGYNPHSEMNEKESAEIVINHVPEGVKMAKSHRLPSILIDFIKTHHGTTRVEYFYKNYQNKFPDKVIDPQDFTYPGPTPATKEEAIMMMADSLEASAKTLDNPSGYDIDQLVDKIVSGKIESGQFAHCNLSFGELEECKAVFKKLLRSIHHVRIEYPD